MFALLHPLSFKPAVLADQARCLITGSNPASNSSFQKGSLAYHEVKGTTANGREIKSAIGGRRQLDK